MLAVATGSVHRLELFGRQLITKRCMAVPSQWVQPYWLAWYWCSYAVCREAQG